MKAKLLFEGFFDFKEKKGDEMNKQIHLID